VACEKIAMLVELAAFVSGVAADETDKGDSIEVHTFLLFWPSVSGTQRVGAAPQARSCFSRGTGTGAPEPERCESKAEAP